MRTLGNSLSLRIALFLPPFPEAPGAGGGRERTQRQRKETERQSLKVNSVDGAAIGGERESENNFWFCLLICCPVEDEEPWARNKIPNKQQNFKILIFQIFCCKIPNQLYTTKAMCCFLCPLCHWSTLLSLYPWPTAWTLVSWVELILEKWSWMTCVTL